LPQQKKKQTECLGRAAPVGCPSQEWKKKGVNYGKGRRGKKKGVN